MMDWDGQVIKHLPIEKHRANVYVLGRDGVVLFRTSGDANKRSLVTLLASIERALAPEHPVIQP